MSSSRPPEPAFSPDESARPQREFGGAGGGWPVFLGLLRRRRWILAAGLAGAVAGGLLAAQLWGTTYVASVQLLRHDTPDPELFQPRPIAGPTLIGLIESRAVRERAGARVTPPLSADAVGAMLSISLERSNDLLNLSFEGDDLRRTVELANHFAEEAVRFTSEMQAREAGEAGRYLEQQQARIAEEVALISAKIRALPRSAQVAATARPTAVMVRLDEARDRLSELLGRYTEAHPSVREQRARVEALEQQLSRAGPGNRGKSGADASAPEDFEVLQDVSKALEAQRLQVAGRLRLVRMLADNPPGYFRIFAAADPERIAIRRPWLRIGFCALLAGLLGLAAAGGAATAAELLDPRLRTAVDVRRVTGLPVLATLGDLVTMSPGERAAWSFRTWTALQNRLSASPNHGLVCGITSAGAGEGRTAWVRLLAEAANRCGFRVLTITTRPTPPTEAKRANPEPVPSLDSALATNILASPAEIAQQLVRSDGPPLVHIPVPGWVWNLERRKEWLTALNQWRNIDNLVILVELPPAATPEAVLLGQNLPNLVWLTDSTKAGAVETREGLGTLRHARCNLVGAVVNRDAPPAALRRLARWVPEMAAVVLAGVFLAVPPAAHAQAPAGIAGLSAAQRPERAEWNRRLTLGPGDVLRIGLHGEPEQTREELAIQPDGRLSFLEAADVLAAGLTVDELRVALDEELARFRRAPRTMVAPVEFHSKKFYLLGRVVRTGVFPLDRPMTIVEAVAQARGFETGLEGGRVVEVADLDRSFLARGDRRVPVDFRKLFAEGDLAENLPLEPGDYLYFPGADQREVHVLGEVASPGNAVHRPGATVVRAIAERGGFTPEAWRHRVLVVRGALQQPETFIVDTAGIVRGETADFPLEPRDIVYVSRRPWTKAEELLEAAASAFTQSVIVFWTTDKVVPVIR